MSLLTLVQNAADRIGIVRPSSVIGSADGQVRQLLSLSQQEGKELARRHPWQSLIKEKTITAIAAEEQTSGIPTDFDRFVDETFYNRTQKRKVEGPLNAKEWADYKGRTTTAIWDAFRVRGNAGLLAPTPTANDSYVYEYVTTYWATTSGSTTPSLAAWAADTNEGILSEELMTDGIVWRFKKAKGLDYAEEFRTYEAQLALMMGRDGGKRKVSMAAPFKLMRPGVTVPEGSWNL